MTLDERALELERRLEGEDRRTVHQLLLVYINVNDTIDAAERIQELIDTLDDYYDDDSGEDV